MALDRRAGTGFPRAAGKHYIPGNARTWLPVNRNFHYWRVGEKAETYAAEEGWWEANEEGTIIQNNMADAERPILWERKRDGRRLNMGAWRLRPLEDTKEKRVMLEDDARGDAMRPWQVVAIMSRESWLDELIHQKRRHDEDCRKGVAGAPARRGRCVSTLSVICWKATRRRMKTKWSMVMW